MRSQTERAKLLWANDARWETGSLGTINFGGAHRIGLDQVDPELPKEINDRTGDAGGGEEVNVYSDQYKDEKDEEQATAAPHPTTDASLL